MIVGTEMLFFYEVQVVVKTQNSNLPENASSPVVKN